MSVQVEKKEHNMATLTIEVSPEEFDRAVQKVYEKQKKNIAVPGFRKGKVPRVMIEKMYGKEIFFEDAANECIPEAYENALNENEDLDVVSRPSINVTQIEAGKPFIFTADVALKPDVELGEYKGLEAEMKEIVVEDSEIDSRLESERQKNARSVKVEDRAVADGDDILLDFEGFVDGEAFEGGKGEDYPLTIGSGSFIPGFEDQLIGAEVGKELDVNVTFPEEYQAKELAGKDALFKCTVKEIRVKEFPELNDEFADEVSEFETIDAWKEDIRDKIMKSKEEQAKRDKENQIVEKAIENAVMDIPDPMVDLQVEQMMQDFAMNMQQQGISIEQYMQITGLTASKMMEDMRPQALKRIQSSLLLEKIAEVEDIQVTEEDIENELKEMAEMYQMELDKLKELMGDSDNDRMKNDLKVRKALDLLREAGVEVPAKEEPAAEETDGEAPAEEE